jgi:hypothetical protein
MVVTSDFGSESPGSSPGSPTKRDNLMKAIKDKKKFGGTSLVPKNHNCRKFGYSYDKEVRRLWRMEAKRIAHKVLMHLPISREEIQKAWSNPYMNLSELGVPYVWDGVDYYERWVEQVYKKLNNVT